MSAHSNNLRPEDQRSSDLSTPTQCLIGSIGRISYSDAVTLQHTLHSQCVFGHIPGILLLLEHYPVITVGVKQSSSTNVLVSEETLREHGVELAETDRGGDVTYHGPGQLVGYSILRFKEVAGDLSSYLRGLEQCIIDVLAELGLEGERCGPAGVWVAGRKICSIGVAVRKWVTYHGFSLNVDPDMSHFSLINPCGLESHQMTSVAELTGESPDMQAIKEACARSFSKTFNLTLNPWYPEVC